MNKLLYVLLSIALVGCGGGNSDSVSTPAAISQSTPVLVANVDTVAQSSLAEPVGVTPTTTNLDIPTPPPSTIDPSLLAPVAHQVLTPVYKWYTVAAENGTFKVKGSQKTRYGVNNTWIEKTYTDVNIPCTNREYGKDPAVGIVKSCQVYSATDPAAPVYSWYTVATENTSFVTVGKQNTRYGSGTTWIEKSYTAATVPCTNVEYGKDPLYGVKKSCQIYATSAPTIPVTPVFSWYPVAAENVQFFVTGAQRTRYGVDGKWIEKSFTDISVLCSNGTYGSDPAPGVYKGCQVYASAAPVPVTPPTTPSTGPVINNALIPAKATGYDTVRIQTVFYHADTGTLAPECTQVSSNCIIYPAFIPSGPNPNDIGAFRIPCDFALMSYDDPIVYPNQPGKSHLHTFFGNTGVNANSTVDSIKNSGNSTCAGGIANRSAYWVPTMIDTKDGRPMVPTANLVYYKCTYALPLDQACDQMQPVPAGLRMVNGNAMNSDPKASSMRYICYGKNGENPGWKTNFADAFADGTCLPGADFVMEVHFPNCWDGVNLDSPDHHSHIVDPETYKSFQGTYPTIPDQYSSRCPADHPVVLPSIAYNIHYAIPDDQAVSRWRLSSDKYDKSLPGGLSGHGDYFMGWDEKVMNTFINNCDRAHRDCHAYLLGDNTILY